MTLLEVLASGKRFRRPEFGDTCYWHYDSGGHITYIDDFKREHVIHLGDDLTREDVFALDWEIEQ